MDFLKFCTGPALLDLSDCKALFYLVASDYRSSDIQADLFAEN